MENIRRHIPPTAEFRKPTGLNKKRPDYLRLVTPPEVKPAVIPTADFEINEPLSPQIKTESTTENLEPTQKTPEIVSFKDPLDVELQDLITWPDHPNLETALKILSEITLVESSLYNLKKHETDPDYNENNRPNETKMKAEIIRLEDQIDSLNSALNLIVIPALAETASIKQHAKSTRERILHFAGPRKEDGSETFIHNPNIDLELRDRSRLHVLKKTGGNEKFGDKIHSFMNDDIDEMMSDIKLLEDWRSNHSIKVSNAEPITPARAITQPQLQQISSTKTQASTEPSFIKRTTGKFLGTITGWFKKAA